MKTTAKTGVIIVAGGSGTRMGGDVPKQFLKLCGKEILARTVAAFVPYSDNIVVVLPEAEMERWNSIAEKVGLCGTHTVCAGGETRFDSVKKGLAALGECNLIAVHDGVRPLVTRRLIEDALGVASEFGSAIPVIEPVDSFRVATAEGACPIDRSTLRAVQTPQVFDAETLRNAYKTRYNRLFTDDASVVEHAGGKLTFCEGERCNIKITTPEDMVIAEAIINSQR